MESLVRRPVSTHGVSWRTWYGDLSAPMEYHGELVRVDILMEYHEKSVVVDSLMKCHEELVRYLHTREAVENWHIHGSVENLYSANETDS